MHQSMASSAQSDQIVLPVFPSLAYRSKVMNLQETGVCATRPLATMAVPIQNFSTRFRWDRGVSSTARPGDDRVALEALHLCRADRFFPRAGLDRGLPTIGALMNVDLEVWAS